MKLTPGKLAGLKKVSNERGVIAAAAMDQRGSLQKSLAKEKGVWVFRTGHPLPSSVADEVLERVRTERDHLNLGSPD